MSVVVEDRLVTFPLERLPRKLLDDLVLVLGLEQRRQASLHHDVHRAGRFFLENKRINVELYLQHLTDVFTFV